MRWYFFRIDLVLDITFLFSCHLAARGFCNVTASVLHHYTYKQLLLLKDSKSFIGDVETGGQQSALGSIKSAT